MEQRVTNEEMNNGTNNGAGKVTVLLNEETLKSLINHQDLEDLNRSHAYHRDRLRDRLTKLDNEIFFLISKYSVKYLGVSFLSKRMIEKTLKCSTRSVQRAFNKLAHHSAVEVYETRRPTGDKRQSTNILRIVRAPEGFVHAKAPVALPKPKRVPAASPKSMPELMESLRNHASVDALACSYRHHAERFADFLTKVESLTFSLIADTSASMGGVCLLHTEAMAERLGYTTSDIDQAICKLKSLGIIEKPVASKSIFRVVRVASVASPSATTSENARETNQVECPVPTRHIEEQLSSLANHRSEDDLLLSLAHHERRHQGTLTVSERSFLDLLKYSGEGVHGVRFLTADVIAEAVGVTARTVQRMTQRLKSRGVIEVFEMRRGEHDRRAAGNIYRIVRVEKDEPRKTRDTEGKKGRRSPERDLPKNPGTPQKPLNLKTFESFEKTTAPNGTASPVLSTTISRSEIAQAFGAPAGLVEAVNPLPMTDAKFVELFGDRGSRLLDMLANCMPDHLFRDYVQHFDLGSEMTLRCIRSAAVRTAFVARNRRVGNTIGYFLKTFCDLYEKDAEETERIWRHGSDEGEVG